MDLPLPTQDGIVPLVKYRLPPETPGNTDDDDNPDNWYDSED